MDRTPKPMEQYVHFKGGRYQVLNLAEMEDTGEILVIYQALYGEGKIYARPLSGFVSAVDRAKYPDAAQYWRFLRVVPPEEEPFPAPDASAPPPDPADTSGFDTAPSAQDAGDDAAAPPVILAFLDAETADEKLEILASARGTLTDEMIDTMAFALGIEIEPGPMDSRYLDLRECLLTISRYEMDRSRFRSSLK